MADAAPKLVALFVIAQLIGIFILSQYINFEASAQGGETVTTETYGGFTPPEVENESLTFLLFIAAVLIGTVIILLLMKYNFHLFWKLWFFVSISVALSFALNAFTHLIIPNISWIVAIGLSLIIAYLKIFRQNRYIHNGSEILIYGGLAAVFVPIINVFSAVFLLIIMSVYDVWAVHHSKHMVKLAKTQIKHNVVAGLTIGDLSNIKPSKSRKPSNRKSAILGGGDIAFPLLFAGALMKMTGDIWSGIAVCLGAALALNILFLISKPGKFYPAMPFVTIGCFIGVLVLFI